MPTIRTLRMEPNAVPKHTIRSRLKVTYDVVDVDVRMEPNAVAKHKLICHKLTCMVKSPCCLIFKCVLVSKDLQKHDAIIMIIKNKIRQSSTMSAPNVHVPPVWFRP